MKAVLATILIVTTFFAKAQHKILFEEHFSKTDLTGYQTSKGISGNCLDLSERAAFRQPIQRKLPPSIAHGSYTISVWVKASIQDDESYAVLTATTKLPDGSSNVLELGKQSNGAWYWSGFKGKNRYDYKPTLQRQPINDGDWHQLVYSFDHLKKEVRLYYDGINVAIYATPQLAGLNKESQLNIGGVAKGELLQWDTFNGMIDEVLVFDGILDSKQILSGYELAAGKPTKSKTNFNPQKVSVMNYNIWHGGNETGKYVGPMRIADVIRSSGADIISMQETYGSGARIADALGYYFYLRSTNLSIMSRFPIGDTIEGEAPFNNGGAQIYLGDGKQILFVTNWINYPFDYWDDLEKNVKLDSASWMSKQQRVNAAKMNDILHAMKKELKQNIPIIFCGDFNTGSHLDWTTATKHLNKGHVMPFPTGILLEKAGFKDAYRVLHPDPLKERGITWSPQFPEAFKDRIDYVYFKGDDIIPLTSKVLEKHDIKYPSDHAAVLITFEVK